MYITLAGEGSQFTNRLFNTIDIKPYSYICLNNISLKKNETLTLDVASKIYFFADYNNVYGGEIPAGTYDIYTLANNFQSVCNLMQNRVKITCDVVRVADETHRIQIKFANRPVSNTQNDLLDLYNPVVEAEGLDSGAADAMNYQISHTGALRSGYGLLRSVGPNADTQSYVGTQIAGGYTCERANGVSPFMSAAAAYLTADGTPQVGYDSQDSATNKLTPAMGMLDFQAVSTNIPQVDNDNSPSNTVPYNQSTDLSMINGLCTFVVGGACSSKDFVLCTSQVAGDSVDVPANLSDFTTGAPNIGLWLRWIDPRDNANEPVIKMGMHNLAAPNGDGAWKVVDSRTAPIDLLQPASTEGALVNITFEEQTYGAGIPPEPAKQEYYAPKVVINTMCYKLTTDSRITIAHYDMDEPAGSAERWYNADGDPVASGFNTTGRRGVYKPFWFNYGSNYDGGACSSHYWGGYQNNWSSLANNNGGRVQGNAFQLKTGAGSIDWALAQGSTVNDAPGQYRTAYPVSRSFNSGATGYKNAYYQVPDMWGTVGGGYQNGRGVINSGNNAIEGTAIPTIMTTPESGAYGISMCCKFDTVFSAWQSVFCYKGLQGSSTTIPDTMLAVKNNIAANNILISKGDGNQEILSLVKASDDSPYTISIDKWIQLACVFQSKAATTSPWLIVGIDEEGTIVKALATTTTGSPQKALYGLGGNDKCDGNQTAISGMVGLIKFFKIIKMMARPYSAGTDYNVEETAKCFCSDILEPFGTTNYFNYNNQNKVIDYFVPDAAGGFQCGLFTTPDFKKPMTGFMGQSIVNSKISNYNPYDYLFTNPLYRQNYQDTNYLSNRVIGINDGFGNNLLNKFLDEGSGYNMTGKSGFVATTDAADSVLLQMGFSKGIPDDSDTISHYIFPYNHGTGDGEGNYATFDAEEEVDTEAGINNNRIHIDNLPIQSYNGKIGAMDRCIYQTTAFLNSTQTADDYVLSSIDVPQKIYISLNNAGELHLNEFKVKITDINDKPDSEIIESNMSIEIKSKEELLITN